MPSTIYFTGKAPAVAQISAVQVTAYDAATTYSITIGGVTVSAAGTTDAIGTAEALAAAFNASAHPYFSYITAAHNGTDTVTCTADVAGIPFVMTATVASGTGTIGSVATTTAATGPNVWASAGNWSGGAIPVTGDTVYIENSNINILWVSGQAAVTLAALHISSTYTGKIGLPIDRFTYSADGSSTNTSYNEYRTTYLAIGATVWRVGYNASGTGGTGSGRIKLNFGTEAFTGLVEASAGATESSLKSIRILGTHATNVLTVWGGSVGVACDSAGETAQLSAIYNGVAGNVQVGTGVTLATYAQSAGSGVLSCAVTNFSVGGGTCRTTGAGAITNWIVTGGTVTHDSSGAVTNVNVADDAVVYWNGNGNVTAILLGGTATFDASRDARAKTLGSTSFACSGTPTVNLDNGTSGITVTNGITLTSMDIEDFTSLKIGRNTVEFAAA